MFMTDQELREAGAAIGFAPPAHARQERPAEPGRGLAGRGCGTGGAGPALAPAPIPLAPPRPRPSPRPQPRPRPGTGLGYAVEPPTLFASAERLGPALVDGVRLGFCGGVHASSVAGRAARGYREDPRFDPDV